MPTRRHLLEILGWALVLSACGGRVEDVPDASGDAGWPDAGEIGLSDGGDGGELVDAGFDGGEADSGTLEDAGEDAGVDGGDAGNVADAGDAGADAGLLGDAGLEDAGTLDGGDAGAIDDAGGLDGGELVDAGDSDAGQPLDDGGTPDGGEADAGADAGVDAGPDEDAGPDAGVDAGPLTITGPTQVDPFAYSLTYSTTRQSDHTYLWTLDPGGTCYNTNGQGCVLNCSGCTITSTTSSGDYEFPDVLFEIAAGDGPTTFTVEVSEYDDAGLVNSGSLTVTVVGGRETTFAARPQVVDAGSWWRVPAAQRVVYPTSAVQSPMPASVVSELLFLSAHAPATAQDNSFIKVGDSITAAPAFLGGYSDPVSSPSCWQDGTYLTTSGYDVRLPDDADLLPTLYHFRSGFTAAADYDGTTQTTSSLGRYSIAAGVGEGAAWATTGSHSPLDQEIAAMNPLYALVMFGTNDVGVGGDPLSDFAHKVLVFQTGYFALVDALAAQGIVPILFTIPPRLNASGQYQWVVPTFNALVRAKAASLQTPLVDYYLALTSSPNLAQPASAGDHLDGEWGIEADGIHPTSGGYNQYCWADTASADAGLNTGYGVRALAALRALDRVVQAVVIGNASVDDGGAVTAAPFTIDTTQTVPIAGGSVMAWGDVEDSADGTVTSTTYSGCATFDGGVLAPGSAAGPLFDYALTLAAPMPLRAVVADESNGYHGVYVLDVDGGCLYSGANLIAGTLDAGTYTVRVHATAAGQTSEYVLAVVQCDPADTRCQ